MLAMDFDAPRLFFVLLGQSIEVASVFVIRCIQRQITHERIPCSLKNSSSSSIFSKMRTRRSLLAKASSRLSPRPFTTEARKHQRMNPIAQSCIPFILAMLRSDSSGRFSMNHSMRFLKPGNFLSDAGSSVSVA